MAVVLTPIDGSTRALRAVPWAAQLAGADGLVILMRAIPPQPSYAEALLTLAGSGEEGVERIQNEWAAVANDDLDEAASLIADTGVTIDRQILEGEPEDAIVAAAIENAADMVAMSSHGRGAIGRAIFGSVADRVVRMSPVPVLVLRTPEDEAPEDPPVRRLIVPLDGSELAEHALPVAVDVARGLAVPVHVVRAVDPAANLPVTRGAFGMAPSVTSDAMEQIWTEAESAAKDTVTKGIATLQAEGIEASGAVLHGSPFFAISEIALPDDLLILTSHGRGGIRRWLLGSVAEKLVREAPAPVLLVPAAGRDVTLRTADSDT
jgi:nucleotide-binding universal stress UspA family protein